MDPQAGHLEALDDRDALHSEDGEVIDVEITRVQIAQTRAEMGDTLEAIKEKLSPQTLMEQAKETVREATIGRAEEAMGHAVDSVKETVSGAADTARQAMSSAGAATRGAGTMILQTLKDNPIPAALTGAGIVWLWMSARQPHGSMASERSYGYDSRTLDSLRGTRRDMPDYPDQQTGFIDQAKDRASDMAGQVQDRVSEFGNRVQDQVSQLGSRVQDQVSQFGGQVQDQMSQLGSQAQVQIHRASDSFSQMLQDNPITLGMIAMALGAGLGLALPTTPQENRMMGEARDQLVDRAQDAVQGVAQKAQSVMHEAMDSAKEEARHQGLTG